MSARRSPRGTCVSYTDDELRDDVAIVTTIPIRALATIRRLERERDAARFNVQEAERERDLARRELAVKTKRAK